MEKTKMTVDFYRMDNQYMNDAIDRIVVKVHTMKKKFSKKIILLTGCGPATGVTSLTINLSLALSMAGWKTLLIDCDLRKGNEYKRAAMEVPIGLSEYLSKSATKEGIVHNTNKDLLDYISCGSSDISAVRLLCSAEMENLIEEASAQYDYVILDCPSINIVSDGDILFPYVDGIALVAALNKTTKKQLEDARRAVSHYNDKYYGLIVNQVDLKQYKAYAKDYDYFEKANMAKKHKDYMKKVGKKKNVQHKIAEGAK